ncbi:hypothetical protein ARMGADRAFT_574571 [Armillaria gallica]|uniref:Uncharacterized protein n=1 Tax=Armillaria gallica TaxID=47427 RepID=A0A2H3E3R7_ARMGA|nr:hypothetical protein ARMGADRAFT_574571 [Armillaria gallica]
MVFSVQSISIASLRGREKFGSSAQKCRLVHEKERRPIGNGIENSFFRLSPPSRIAINSSSASIDHRMEALPSSSTQFVAPTVAAPQPERRSDLVRKDAASR